MTNLKTKNTIFDVLISRTKRSAGFVLWSRLCLVGLFFVGDPAHAIEVSTSAVYNTYYTAPPIPAWLGYIVKRTAGLWTGINDGNTSTQLLGCSSSGELTFSPIRADRTYDFWAVNNSPGLKQGVLKCYYRMSRISPPSTWEDERNSHISVLYYGNQTPSSAPTPRGQCSMPGSVIRAENKSFSESFDIVGAPFSLVYSSDFSSGYVAGGSISLKKDFVENGFTVSNHHFYDRTLGKLYLGSGGILSAKSRQVTPDEFYVVEPSGAEIYVFSSDGRHLKTLNSHLGTTKFLFTYSADRLAIIEDHYGSQYTFDRNSGGVLRSIATPFGQVTSINTDSTGRLLSIVDPRGRVDSFWYGSTDLVFEISHKDGKVTEYDYNGQGELISEQHIGGSSWQISSTPSANGSSVRFTTGMGRATTQNISQDGSIYSRVMSLPDGSQTTYEEDDDGASEFWSSSREEKMITSDDARFGDLLRRVVSSELTYGASTSITNFGWQVSPAPSTNTDFFSYDTISNSVSSGGETVVSVWDRIAREETTTSTISGTRKMTFNSNEDLLTYQVGNDVPTSLVRDAYGRVTQVSQSGGPQQSMVYNSEGFVSSVTNSLNQSTQFLYDANGNPTSVGSPDGTITIYEYDSKGRVISFEVSGKLKHLFGYDVMGAMQSYRAPTSSSTFDMTQITYNLDGQVTSVQRPMGDQISYLYNSSGLPWSMSGGGQSITTSYFANSSFVSTAENSFNGEGVRSIFTYHGELLRSEELRDVSSNLRYAKLEWDYDSDHRITSRRVYPGNLSSSSQVTYVRDSGGKIIQVGALALATDPATGRITGSEIDNLTDSTTYDSFGRLATYSAYFNSAVVYSYSITRDVIGRISTLSENIQGESATYAYTYDPNGRLVEVKKNSVTVHTRTYDTNGNRVSGSNWGSGFTATYDTRDRITALGSVTYSYNSVGDRLSSTPLLGSANTYGYDILSNLRTAQTPLGLKSYQDDASSRLSVTKLNGSFQRGYLYQGDGRIAAEFDATGQITKEYVHAFWARTPAYMVTGGAKFRILTDHLGSPRLVINTQTGEVAQRLDYLPGGRIARDTNSCFQPYGFAGGIWDAETGFTRFGVRNYDARTESWTTMDPILLDGRGTNFYMYSKGDPINFLDNGGMFPKNFEEVGFCLFGNYEQQMVNYGSNLKNVETELSRLSESLAPKSSSNSCQPQSGNIAIENRIRLLVNQKKEIEKVINMYTEICSFFPTPNL